MFSLTDMVCITYCKVCRTGSVSEKDRANQAMSVRKTGFLQSVLVRKTGFLQAVSVRKTGFLLLSWAFSVQGHGWMTSSISSQQKLTVKYFKY